MSSVCTETEKHFASLRREAERLEEDARIMAFSIEDLGDIDWSIRQWCLEKIPPEFKTMRPSRSVNARNRFFKGDAS